MAPSVRFVLYATAREAVGVPRVVREIPEGGFPLRGLLDDLGREYPALRRVLATSRFVLNGEYVSRPETLVHPGDEIAIHPPYSGG